MNNIENEKTKTIKLNDVEQTYCGTCIICGEITGKSKYPQCTFPIICEDCIDAIKFAKRLREHYTMKPFYVEVYTEEDENK